MGDIRRVLIVGYSIRYIASSAKRSGYEVHCIDYFEDIDLKRCAKVYPLGDITTEEEIQSYIDGIGIEFDAIILGSGFERFGLKGNILNNNCEIMEEVTNKRWLADRLSELEIRHPETYSSRDPHYPAIAKPLFGAGGIDIFPVNCEDDLPEDDSFLLQEFITGMPVSVSVISTEGDAMAIAVNEQIIGEKKFSQLLPFGYCGSITPFLTDFEGEICKIAEDLILDLGLIGTNGVDFILTKEGPYVIEVNPRFQATLDTIELATGLNIFNAHVKAFGGELIKRKKMGRYAAKTIVFTDEGFELRSDLDREGILDISPAGRVIPVGDPVATAVGLGASRTDALDSMMENVLFIQSKIEESKTGV